MWSCCDPGRSLSRTPLSFVHHHTTNAPKRILEQPFISPMKLPKISAAAQVQKRSEIATHIKKNWILVPRGRPDMPFRSTPGTHRDDSRDRKRYLLWRRENANCDRGIHSWARWGDPHTQRPWFTVKHPQTAGSCCHLRLHVPIYPPAAAGGSVAGSTPALNSPRAIDKDIKHFPWDCGCWRMVGGSATAVLSSAALRSFPKPLAVCPLQCSMSSSASLWDK